MTLAFSQQLNGKPTYFPHKIICGQYHNNLISDHDYFVYHDKIEIPTEILEGKIHTMRDDPGDRWKAGVKIHFVINNRTKKRYQFAPVLPCISTQKVVIKYSKKGKIPKIFIDGRRIDLFEIAILSQNDGFESINDFFKYFNTSTTKKLIHWTNKKY